MKKIVPYDLMTAIQIPNWTSEFHWPLPFSEIVKESQAMLRRYVNWIATLENDNERHVGLLALHILPTAAYLIETVLAIQTGARTGIALKSADHHELNYLQGLLNIDSLPGPHAVRRARLNPKPRFSSLKQLAISTAWNRWRMIGGYENQGPISIQRSFPLIQSAAPVYGVRFVYPEVIIQDRDENKCSFMAIDADKLAKGFTASLSDVDGLEEPYRQRLNDLLEWEAQSFIKISASHLAKIDSVSSIPERLWIGSGAPYIQRLLALGAIRRGAEVVGHSHAGATMALVRNKDIFTILDLCVSHRYVLPTRRYVDFAQQARLGQHTLIQHKLTFEGSNGDKRFKKIHLTKVAKHSRLRVLYVPNLNRGARQFLDPCLPEIVYSAWQVRLSKILSTLPIQLSFKPHPEGVLGGNMHPLQNYLRITSTRFEKLLQKTQLFIFDYFATTALFQAMCTNKPIVFVDVAKVLLQPEIDTEFRHRCCVLPTREDQSCVPYIDAAELSEAVLAAPTEVDPGFFRKILAGNQY